MKQYDIGLDLGTTSIIIATQEQGVVFHQPSIGAVDIRSSTILAVGDKALRMVGRVPSYIDIIRPLRDGIIQDHRMTNELIVRFINEVCRSRIIKPRVSVCVPAAITGIEADAVVEAVMAAGARQVFLVDEPVAAALGAGLDIRKPMGCMVIDIGGGSTDIAVISMGGRVRAASLPVAGNAFDQCIAQYVQEKFNIAIGPLTAEAPRETKAALISKIYTAYSNRLRTAGAMDFDDLIFHTVQMLKTDAEAREYYQQKFRYVVVDEYQDTSVAQFHLVRLLAGGSNNVCVVGDDDQSIYKFRGATIENILNFEKVFAGAKTIRLEQNYRSTSNILNAANSVIKNNNGRKGKTLWTQNGDGDKVHHYTAASEQDEASHVAEVIGQNLKNGASLKDHAVLYRMNAQSNPIETYFARAGIPYRIVGGQRFFDRKEVKDINSYMAVVVNPRDDVRLRRIINEPARKIGATTIDKIGELAAANGVPMMEIIREASSYPALGRAASALNAFYSMYRELCDLSVTLPLDEFAGEVIRKTGYEAMLKAQKEEGETRLENLGQLISSVKTYAEQNGEDATLSGFLEEVALIADLDSYDEDADSVTLMTMHSAKGLEFPYVFIIGMEDGVFPGDLARYSEEEMEEERRLCYVGITRAKKELYLSSSRSRMIFGQTRRNPPSCFLDEIDPNVMDETESPELAYSGGFGAGYGSYSTNVPGGRSGYSGASRGYLNSEYNRGSFGSKYAGGFQSGFASGGHESPNYPGGRHTVQSSSFGAGYGSSRVNHHSGAPVAPAGGGVTTAPAAPARKKAANFAAGDLVDHKVFGRGKVLKVTPVAGDCIVEIQFDRVGIKKTMANYAPLTKLTSEE